VSILTDSMPLTTFESFGTLDQDPFVAGHFVCTNNYVTIRDQGRSDWLMTYTLEGEGYFMVDDCYFPVRAGDVAIVKAGVPHHYGKAEGKNWSFLWVHFPPDPQVSRLWSFPEQRPGFYLTTTQHHALQERITGALNRIIMDIRLQRPFWDLLCQSALHELMWLLSRQAALHIDPRVEEVLQFLSEHMREPLKIIDIARRVGLSDSRLAHLFKDTTGHSIIETLNRMRLREAATLLVHTIRSAAEIADDVGFIHYNHFLKQFKKQYGISPGAYRKQNSTGKQ